MSGAANPDTMVHTPEMANRYGTQGVAHRSRIIHVRSRNQPARSRVSPDTSRLALNRVYMPRFSATANSDAASVC